MCQEEKAVRSEPRSSVFRHLLAFLCGLRLECTVMPDPDGEVVATHEVGPHHLEVERPDIVHIRYHGDVTVEHFQAFDAVIDGMSPPETRIYLLRDGRRGGFALPETRAYMARRARVSRLIAVVTYGTTFLGKTLVTMTNTAIRSLKQEGPDLAFVETEAEARAWIAEHRKRVREGQGPPSRF